MLLVDPFFYSLYPDMRKCFHFGSDWTCFLKFGISIILSRSLNCLSILNSVHSLSLFVISIEPSGNELYFFLSRCLVNMFDTFLHLWSVLLWILSLFHIVPHLFQNSTIYESFVSPQLVWPILSVVLIPL